MKKPNKTEEFHKNLALAKADRTIPHLKQPVSGVGAKEVIQTAKGLLSDFINSGLSLLEFAPNLEALRENKSYRSLGYDTWKDCCESGIEASQQWVNEIIRGGQIRAALPKSEAKKITSVSQTRALSTVPKEHRADAVKETSKDGATTPKKIADFVGKLKSAEPTIEAAFRAVVKDSNGDELPEEIAKEFERSREEVKEIRAKLNEVRRWLENEEQFKAEIARTAAIESVKDVLSMVVVGAGDFICPICKGKKCKVCSKRGFVSKLFYSLKISDDKK